MRLFVSIDLPPDQKEALLSIQRKLRANDDLEGIRWAQKEQFHLTLKFLGETAEDKLEAVSSCLAQCAQGVQPFQLRLGTVGSFGQGRHLRNLWVGLKEGTGELGHLVQRMEDAIVTLDFPREERPFSPHITIARTQKRTPVSSKKMLEARLMSIANSGSPSFQVDEFKLMRSETLPQGSRYSVVSAFLFR